MWNATNMTTTPLCSASLPNYDKNRSQGIKINKKKKMSMFIVGIVVGVLLLWKRMLPIDVSTTTAQNIN
jgi:hypothetical protein